MGPESPTEEDGQNLLLSYRIDSGQSTSEAVVAAFLASNIDVFREPTVLEDWISTEALDKFTRNTAGTALCVSVRIWGHRVRITDDEVCIYADTTPQSADGHDTVSPDP